MKDLYELLDDINVDDETIKMIEDELMEATDLEKQRVKKHVMKNIKKKTWQRNSKVAAAVVSALLVGTTTFGITNPAYAAKMPVIGDIFRFLDYGNTGIYDEYQANANEINVTKEDNGISVTIKDAIFDGRTLFYTYEITTTKDLGECPTLGGGVNLNIKGYRGGMTGSSQVTKVSDDTYVGQDEVSLEEERDSIQAVLDLKDMIVPENNQTIKGRWKFKMNIDAIEGKLQQINESVEKDGFKVTIDSIQTTPISFKVDFQSEIPESFKEDWHAITTEIEVKDDLGNTYAANGASGHGEGDSNTMYMLQTFGKLDENATKLIITPKVTMASAGGGVAIDEKGNETEIVYEGSKLGEDGIVFDEIIVDLN